MAVSPEMTINSPFQFNDTSGLNPVTMIIGTGAPDGAADPMKSAGVGSLYFRPSQSDDLSAVYMKVDTDESSNDWVLVLTANCGDSHDINGSWEWQTDKKIYFRDAGQYIYSPAANAAALALAASGDTWRVGDMGSSNYIQVDFAGEATLVGTARFNPRAAFEYFEDFHNILAIDEAIQPLVLNSGSDDLAIDPDLVAAAERGVLVITTGDDTGATAVDAAQIVVSIPVQADSGGLVFETRLHINTAITNISVFAGLTDITTLEEPFTNAADVITSNATDAVGLLYDTSATTDEWWMCAVDTDEDDTGNAATGTAPVADTYQVLRVEVPADGVACKFYIDGTLEGTFASSFGVSPDVNLYATVIACGDGTASKTVDVDYIYIGHNR